MPNPPTWIRTRSTTSPKAVNRSTSTVASPVTVVADVEVNNACDNPGWGPSTAKGSRSRAAPMAMSEVKAESTSRAGFSAARSSRRWGTAATLSLVRSPLVDQ